MKKIILTIVLIITLTGCQLINDINQDIYTAKSVANHSLYYHPDFDSIDSYEDITLYLKDNLIFKSGSENENLREVYEILESGYTNCAGYTLCFMNIAYFALGEKTSFTTVLYDNLNRTIADGGSIDHAIVMLSNGQLYEPQDGKIVEYSSIGYTYSFYKVFSK